MLKHAILCVMLVAAVSMTYAGQWIQVGTGTGSAKVSVVASNALGATVTIEIPGIQTDSVAINGAQYLKLTIPGAVSAGLDVGKPEVPAVPVLLARPTGSTVTLSILSIQTETLHVARVFPMQPPSKLGEQAGPLVVNGSFYASDVEYPSSRLSSPRPATWRDLDVVNVQVYPVAVRPAQHEVVVTSRITFRVDFTGGHYPARVANWMQPMYRRLIQNYDALGLTSAAQEPSGTKCLVFRDSTYAANQSLDSLCKLMTRLGDSTEIINVPDSVPAVAESIKLRIIERYYGQNHALHWVFLVGNYSQIPPRYDYTHDGAMYNTGDYWYSDLTGYVDSCDGYPEVGIARLSPEGGANGNIDLSGQIAKISAYMMGTDADTWLTKTTLVAHREDEPTNVVIGVDTMPLSFYPSTRDTVMGRTSATWNDSVKSHVERGTGVLIYLGNGEGDRWDTWNQHDESWTNDDVSGLNNQYTPVVFNIACECGDCTLETPSLSERWMRKYPGGAVASYGSHGIAFRAPADCQCYAAVRATGDYWPQQNGQHDYGAPVFDIGGIGMFIDAYLSTWRPGGVPNIYRFMWLGNPAMPVWSGGVPDSAVVSYPSQIPTGSQSFHVSVKTSSGQPFENARVCAYRPGDFYAVGLTNGNGDVWLSLTAESTGSFYVSASEGHELLSSPGQPHTPMLPYFGTSEVSGDTAFATPDMTYPNWGRKLVRDPNTSTLHVVYTNKDSVFYTWSTDDGVNWSTAEPIGAGAYPASALVPAGGLVPWVAYVTSDGSIVRAIRNGLGAWDKATIFQSSDGARAGAPSLAPGLSVLCIANAGVTYPVSVWPANNYVYFNAFTALSISPPETVDAAGPTSCYGASIAWTPGYANHVAWIRGQSVFYRQRLYNGVWSSPHQVSDTLVPTEPASNPSVEAYGESLFCVWRGPHDSTNLIGNIWRRAHNVNWNPTWWPTSPSNQSQSPDSEADFPVMATNFVTVWHEQVSPDSTQIWDRSGWDQGPVPLIQESLPSRYPQVEGYGIGPGIAWYKLYTLWTQQTSSNPPQYALGFNSHVYIPMLGKHLGPSHEDFEPALYYAAKLGQPEQSPYCLSRGGFARFGSWNTDTSATALTYRLPYLDPLRVYKFCAVLYHEGDSTWNAQVRCDSGPWHHVRVAPNVPDTFWLQVPKASYKNDARIVLDVARVTGGYVSLARLKLYQIEEKPSDDGGVQSWGSGITYVTRLRGCSPNPFARGTSVNYELAQYGPVELTVHDVSGRLLRRLESGPRHRGFHAVRWNCTDNRGRVVPAGVYFVRLSAEGKVSTGRITLVR